MQVEAQSTAEVEADSVPLSTDSTTEPDLVLDLRAHFESEEDMLQYIAGFWEADGGMVMTNGSLRLFFHQSNKAFLESLKAEYGASGVYQQLPENDGTVEWGKYSNGELPQRLRYDNSDAIRVLNTFAPYVVSKLLSGRGVANFAC